MAYTNNRLYFIRRNTIIRFSGRKSGVSYYDIQIDDISVATVPCFTPLSLSVKPLLSSVDYSVKPSALGNPDGYEYALTSSGTPPDSGTFTSNLTGTITGLAASTNYFMHFRSVCTGAGNSAWISQNFTTATANCIPQYFNVCSNMQGFSIRDFKLKGENGTLLYNAAVPCTQNGYYDFSSSSNVTLAQGKSYSCMVTTDTSNVLDIWIDFNDDSAFTYNEKVVANFASESKIKNLISLFIPENARTGSHRLRIRMSQNDPCLRPVSSNGQARDYTVTIVGPSAATPYAVSPGTTNNCVNGGNLSINEASNNNNVWVPLTDTNNNIIASVNANGNDLNRVDIYQYINTGTTRKTADDKFYLDRNVQISVESQPTTSVSIRIYILQTEFDALKLADPSIQDWEDLWMNKTAQPCGSILGSGLLLQPVDSGNVTNGFYVEYNIPGFSSFYFNNGAATLPVKLKNFSARKNGKTNRISWTTAAEFNNVGFQIEESKDGITFTNLSFVTSRAIAGNSFSELHYTYDSNSDDQDTYYRLKQIDKDGRRNYSNTVFVKGVEIRKMTLNDVFPNPVKNWLVLDLSSAINDKVSILISGVSTHALVNDEREIYSANNQIKVNISQLRAGTYLIKVKSKTTGEQVIAKFVKL